MEQFTPWFRSGIGTPSVNHVGFVIFLEFFSWGLLTKPVIIVLNEAFLYHTFLMGSLIGILGNKGPLAFLCAPIIGVLSDIYGRKLFLILSVFFTCAPIPLILINTWWFFGAIFISGLFSVTLPLALAYVADVTPGEKERLQQFGGIIAISAAALLISQGLGTYLEMEYDTATVVGVATAIAMLDVLFILFVVPESLPRKLEMSPCTAFRKATQDKTRLLLHNTILLSYLPEAGQNSCLYVYLRLVVGFEAETIVLFMTFLGIMTVVAETVGIKLLNKCFGLKKIALVGLFLLMDELILFGFCTNTWIIWAAGLLLAWSSVTYPAISAFASIHADPDKQGLAQGLVLGVRGLCNSLGPILFGLIFYEFHIDLNEDEARFNLEDRITSAGKKFSGESNEFTNRSIPLLVQNSHQESHLLADIMPGPPFVFGAVMVLLAIIVFLFIPDHRLGRQDNYNNEPELENLSNPQTIAPLSLQYPGVYSLGSDQ